MVTQGYDSCSVKIESRRVKSISQRELTKRRHVNEDLIHVLSMITVFVLWLLQKSFGGFYQRQLYQARTSLVVRPSQRFLWVLCGVYVGEILRQRPSLL